MKKAIILFSGGLDSMTCLAIAKSQGFDCYALSFTYGQKHSIELEYAITNAQYWKVTEHKILSLPLDQIALSSLINIDLHVPDFKTTEAIPTTYVPGRNTIFLSFALSWGESIGAYDIFIGANDLDYSGYPDCRPEFLNAFETMAKLGTKTGIEGHSFKIHAPLLRMNKADIIKEGLRLGVDYSKTLSCYRPNENGEACGSCDSCTYRKKGFAEALVSDPTLYYKI